MESFGGKNIDFGRNPIVRVFGARNQREFCVGQMLVYLISRASLAVQWTSDEGLLYSTEVLAVALDVSLIVASSLCLRLQCCACLPSAAITHVHDQNKCGCTLWTAAVSTTVAPSCPLSNHQARQTHCNSQHATPHRVLWSACCPS